LAGNARVLGSSIDAATAAYLRLLNDPCAADLVPATYGGTGSGYLMRTKQFVYPLSTAVDAVLEFTPGWSNQPTRLTTATTSGGALSVVSATGIPAQLAVVSDTFRCVAACVKIYYTGSELNRAGMVFGNLLDGPSLASAEVPGIAAPGYAASAARYVRLGSEMHEFRWCPAETDQTFVTEGNATPAYAPPEGSTLQLGFVGVPANTVSFEITAVWEWQPIKLANNTNSAIVTSSRGPVTPLPLSATLHRLGPLARWATDPSNHGKIVQAAQFARGVYSSVRRIAPAMAALAM